MGAKIDRDAGEGEKNMSELTCSDSNNEVCRRLFYIPKFLFKQCVTHSHSLTVLLSGLRKKKLNK